MPAKARRVLLSLSLTGLLLAGCDDGPPTGPRPLPEILPTDTYQVPPVEPAPTDFEGNDPNGIPACPMPCQDQPPLSTPPGGETE